MLAIIVSRAKAIGLRGSATPNDIVLFLDHDLDQAKNMKLVLCLFEQLSGLKNNFHKSEIFCFGESKEWESQYSNLFGCKVGSYPFRYLGIPMHFRKLNNKDWKMIEERIQRNLSNWKGKMLSFGGRLVLLNSVLSSLPITTIKKKKNRPISWPILCQPNEQGGLGVQNLDIQNKCLLSKWLFKLCNEDAKQKKAKGLTLLEKSNGSKKPILQSRTITRLSRRLPKLFTIVRSKHATVVEVLRTNPYNVSFRRALTGNKFNEWHNLVARIASVNLQEGRDQFVWGFAKGVILTKDNLAKRNRKGRTNCEFCSKQETIQHLFFECHYAKFLWRAIH
ncbi:hypothetical protein U9M48_001845, partial [Paspalum notatum var. saurae]